MGDEPKKDLTSLIELSALELQKNPHLAHGGEGSLADVKIEKVTEEDFGNLEELSKMAAEQAAHEAPPPPPPPAPAETPAAEAAPAAIAALDTPPGEAPGGAAPAGAEAVPSFLDGQPPVAEAGAGAGAGQPQSFELPSFSQVGTGESPALDQALPIGGEGAPAAITPDMSVPPPTAANESPPGMAPSDATPAPLEPAASAEPAGGPQMAINEGFPSTPQPVPPRQQAQSLQNNTRTVTDAARAQAGPPPPTAPKSALDPNRPPVKAAPAGAAHAVKGAAPGAAKQDLSDLKKFADKISIGKPNIEGAPAFSLLIRTETNHFDEKTIKAIEAAVTSEDFGIRLEDVAIQLSAGKLLVPQISEFAAVTLAQKLRDVVDNIEVDLAGEIFKSTAAEVDAADETMLLDTEEFESHREEVHDIGAEPRSPDDLFSTNLSELKEFQVTRILSIVMASEVVPAAIAENPSGKEFEGLIEKLTLEIIDRAFKLGAHGVLGLSFTLRAIDAFRDAEGKIRRAYRLLGSGTAVRVRRRPTPLASAGAPNGGSSIGGGASDSGDVDTSSGGGGAEGGGGGEPPAEPGK